MGQAGQGGGCPAFFLGGGGHGIRAGSATGPFLVYICSVGALPKLGWPVQLPACHELAGFLYDANEGSGRRGGGGDAFVLHLSLLEGPPRETRGLLRPKGP